MKIKFLFFLIIINNIKLILSSCSLGNLNNENSPTYFQNVENIKFLLPSTGNLPDFEELTEITAHCSSGFQTSRVRISDYNYIYLEIPGNEIILTCVDNKFKINYASIERPNSNNLDDLHEMERENYLRIYNDERIKCVDNTIGGIYEFSTETFCNGSTYFNGLNFKNYSLHFADFCFNYDNNKLEYLHYASNEFKSTSLIEQLQKRSDPLYLSKGSLDHKLPPNINTIPEKELQTKLFQKLGWQAKLIKYEYANLLPQNFYTAYFNKSLGKYDNLQKFIGWKNLIEGNWRKFHNLLRIRSINENYDVYTGTSGVATLPSRTNGLEELFVQYYGKEFVPNYIWAYLKSQSNTEEFVVIGVNSPVDDNNICEDICDNILWLNPMKEIRKMSTFGSLFCCKVEDVLDILHGLPNLQKINPIKNKGIADQ